MPNSGLTLRMYPRGFLGADVQSQDARSPKAFIDNVKRFQYEVSPSRPGVNHAPPNPYIEGLYAEYIKRSIQTGSFEYRRAVLAAALRAFGTVNFEEWYFAQYSSPACGDLHKRFLNDMLKFLQEGRREMSLETWAALVKMTDEGNDIGDVSEYAKKFFGVAGTMHQSTNNILLVDIVQQWCSRPGGLEDMLGTLHILFGSV